MMYNACTVGIVYIVGYLYKINFLTLFRYFTAHKCYCGTIVISITDIDIHENVIKTRKQNYIHNVNRL